MNTPTALTNNFQPQVITIPVSSDISDLITNAETELKKFAENDTNKCWGYFPALKEKNRNLNECKKFHDALPKITQNNKVLDLNFVRLSLIQQKGDSPYHMDSDSKTALTGDTATIDSRLVWRLLLNFSSEHSRTLGYLDLDTSSITLTTEGGYIHYTGDTAEFERSVVIPPRTKNEITGVLFCASRVLHTGKDDEFGHFVAGYGSEEPA